jgi:predicted DNA-binding transcriptional regulator AlpA
MIKETKGGITMSWDQLPEFFDVADYMRLTGRSKAAAYRDVAEPGFPSVKLGRELKIVKKDFIKWLDKRMAAVK